MVATVLVTTGSKIMDWILGRNGRSFSPTS